MIISIGQQKRSETQAHEYRVGNHDNQVPELYFFTLSLKERDGVGCMLSDCIGIEPAIQSVVAMDH